MVGFYEAVVTTSDGVYRAYPVSDDRVCVFEDGVAGIADYINLNELDEALRAPEYLVQLLIWWVYEHARGLQIETAVLRWRGQSAQ